MLSMLIAATLASANPSPITMARSTEVATTSTTTAAPAAPKAEKRYCFKGAVTGSRLVKTKCQTRAEWMKQGIDPTEAN